MLLMAQYKSTCTAEALRLCAEVERLHGRDLATANQLMESFAIRDYRRGLPWDADLTRDHNRGKVTHAN